MEKEKAHPEKNEARSLDRQCGRQQKPLGPNASTLVDGLNVF